ncbi:diguanylate cyclase [Novosphingobium panipatense]|uniref:sensor domain-containing diguanylate cyclase n=1 Tax=Novosphingobium TaxID=165696 RepID=UPI000CDA6BE1|nr:sensor domain-containing diguanylate cyclase [Novosphingobium sp. HII-3]
MTEPPLAEHENERLAALYRLDILDTPPEEPFEHVIALVRSVLDVPMAAVSLVDKDRQWFKAQEGLNASETDRSVSFCTHTIAKDEPFSVPDALEDPRFSTNSLVTGEPGIRSYAGVPLRTPDGFAVGALCAMDRKPRRFTDAEMEMLANFARIVENEFALRRMAEQDSMTGALTRRAFWDQVRHEMERYKRHGRPCSLVLGDLDHFKHVNDTYGHPAGDAVLTEVSSLVLATKRTMDVLGRLGGEEFALLLPDTEESDGFRAVERFRKLLAGHEIALPSGETLRVTASFGIAGLTPDILTVEAWMKRADEALYRAKRAGRNRCECAADEPR